MPSISGLYVALGPALVDSRARAGRPPGRKAERGGVLDVSKRPEDRRSALRGAAAGMALAFEFVGAVFLFWLLGLAVDSWLDTRPWGQAIGALIGWAGGSLHVYYAAQRRER
jgi:F0F1-type ATP synthase assembly protein I